MITKKPINVELRPDMGLTVTSGINQFPVELTCSKILHSELTNLHISIHSLRIHIVNIIIDLNVLFRLCLNIGCFSFSKKQMLPSG